MGRGFENAGDLRQVPFATALWRYSRSLAQLAKGDRAGAAKGREQFEEATGKVPADAHFSVNKQVDVVKLAHEVVGARFGDDAIAH